ncbi:MAG: rhodanese-like domain-containing protein [Prolixibacteraceae bacterium]|jgi:rhodanese-related sulfurtransferase|nr:rhodanese-like domain-containing protein [Prolixibacteraceae bacterium]
MNRFLKDNILWLSLVGLALMVVVSAYIFRPKYPNYQTDMNQSLNLIRSQSKQVLVKELAGKQIIDIRPSDQFEQGHPQNAINIPVRQLLDKESVVWLQKLSENGEEAVLCASNELLATAPWTLLQQLGYKNILLLKGGISDSGELVDTELASSETTILDMTAIRTKPETVQAPVQTEVKKKPEAVIPVRKAVSSGGGC